MEKGNSNEGAERNDYDPAGKANYGNRKGKETFHPDSDRKENNGTTSETDLAAERRNPRTKCKTRSSVGKA